MQCIHRLREKEKVESGDNCYQMLFYAIPEAVLVAGADANGIPSEIIEVNQVTCDRTGFSREELLQMNPLDLLDTSVPKELFATDEQNIRSVPFVFESTCKTKNGTRIQSDIIARTMEMDGRLVVIVTARDASEAKEAHEALRLSEERFAKAFNLAPSMMAISTIEEGRFLCVNDSFVKSTGYRHEELIFRTAEEIGFWLKPGQRKQIVELLHQQQSLTNYEIEFKSRVGQIKTCLISAQKIQLGKEAAVLSVINDITELKHYENELARLDRLNLVGEMAAGIGHEIRNPLTTVQGFLQLLKAEEENGEHLGFYDLMIDEIHRANSIITAFLSLAKDRWVEVKDRDINDIIRKILPLLQAEAIKQEKYIKFNFGDIPLVQLDANEIRQLILNLVRNGLESMSVGGTVEISSYQEAGQVVLAVRDEGSGIPVDIMPKLGTPFFTTKEYQTGLGLAVCYSIAARHNAAIDVITNSGGTKVLVKFKTD